MVAKDIRWIRLLDPENEEYIVGQPHFASMKDPGRSVFNSILVEPGTVLH